MKTDKKMVVGGSFALWNSHSVKGCLCLNIKPSQCARNNSDEKTIKKETQKEE